MNINIWVTEHNFLCKICVFSIHKTIALSLIYLHLNPPQNCLLGVLTEEELLRLTSAKGLANCCDSLTFEPWGRTSWWTPAADGCRWQESCPPVLLWMFFTLPQTPLIFFSFLQWGQILKRVAGLSTSVGSNSSLQPQFGYCSYEVCTGPGSMSVHRPEFKMYCAAKNSISNFNLMPFVLHPVLPLSHIVHMVNLTVFISLC